MRLVECFLTNNRCYKTGTYIQPKGVMVHSTAANNQYAKRYAQPTPGCKDYDKIIDTIGRNKYNNSWNRSDIDKCTHAIIGLLADGNVGTVQTLPWNLRGWHAGTGTKGSANGTHISFEICEDDLKDAKYFAKVYQEAVELTAMLCTQGGFNPLEDGVVICHKEGNRRGIASNHGDVEHWFPKFGKTMDDFRKDVDKLVHPPVEEKKPAEPVKQATNTAATSSSVESAKYFDKVYAKKYKVNASAGLNMRCGAGTSKAIVSTLKNKTAFTCYGYYNKTSDGNIWLYGVAADGKKGYCILKYLK